MQDSVLEPLITVQEAMTFVANIKLSVKVNQEDKEALVSGIFLIQQSNVEAWCKEKFDI